MCNINICNTNICDINICNINFGIPLFVISILVISLFATSIFVISVLVILLFVISIFLISSSINTSLESSGAILDPRHKFEKLGGILCADAHFTSVVGSSGTTSCTGVICSALKNLAVAN